MDANSLPPAYGPVMRPRMKNSVVSNGHRFDPIAEFVSRAYGAAQFRTSWVAMNSAPGLGPTDDRVRVMRSLDDAVTALVAWDALDEADRAEVLGRWGDLVR